MAPAATRTRFCLWEKNYGPTPRSLDCGAKSWRMACTRLRLHHELAPRRQCALDDPACPKVPGDGTFRGIGGIVGSGPNDIWLTPDGAYLYQIYGNASKLVGYAVQPDGSLDEVTSASIPYNSPQGLTGF